MAVLKSLNNQHEENLRRKNVMGQEKKAARIAGVVGLGLIGGSIALDLKTLGWEVRGLTNRPITVEIAKRKGLATQVSTDPEIISECELVILAMPLEQLLQPDKAIINALSIETVVTDVGSVKEPVLKLWEKLHPRFVGSHPMAGTNQSGVESGQTGLFQHRPWVSTPNQHTDPEALESVKKLALSLGSNWITADASSHDQAVALISHLPVLISAALLRTLEKEDNAQILKLARQLSSSGFADTTRVGGGNPQLGTAMAVNNTNAIIEGLASYKSCLVKIEETILKGKWNDLNQELERAKALRPSFINSNPVI